MAEADGYKEFREFLQTGCKHNYQTIEQDKLFFWARGLEHSEKPILILLHGYPQSNFMWRHIVAELPGGIPLFIPDIPGYGRSPPLTVPHSKTNQGSFILSFLESFLKRAQLLERPRPLIIVGHDRGARICHRLAVDNPCSKLPIVGAVLLDIVPTAVQFKTFGTPSASVGSYHWPFLANVEIAVPMIMAQGGDKFVEICMKRWAGTKKSGWDAITRHDALKVYQTHFKSESVVRATCDDYRAGAFEDIEEQTSDQEKGRKINIPLVVVYSEEYLGRRYDVKKVWREWMGKGALTTIGLQGDQSGSVGHFIAEEESGLTAKSVAQFYQQLQGSG